MRLRFSLNSYVGVSFPTLPNKALICNSECSGTIATISKAIIVSLVVCIIYVLLFISKFLKCTGWYFVFVILFSTPTLRVCEISIYQLQVIY